MRGRTKQIPPELGDINPRSEDSAERQVYGLIRRAIMMGTFEPGAQLTGRSIATGLGVSPTPVRDALKRLEADGVVEGRSRSSYILLKLSRDQFLELLEIRSILEGQAAAKAAKRTGAQDIARLNAINERYRRASKKDSLRINFQFHFEIYKLGASPILLGLIETLWMRIGPVMHLHFLEYDLEEVALNHAAIIAALKKGNALGAQRALRRDLSDAARVIAPHLSNETTPSTSTMQHKPRMGLLPRARAHLDN